MHASDLLGVWIIRSFDLEDQQTGERSQPWGKNPSGTVVFHPGGRMFALITPGGRALPMTDAERSAAFQEMLAYSGPYRINPPNLLVTTVDMAWFEPWVGTEQVRYRNLDGDDLTLTSAPLHMPGGAKTVVAVVRWKREVSARCGFGEPDP